MEDGSSYPNPMLVQVDDDAIKKYMQAFRDRHSQTVFRQSQWLRQQSITDFSESECDDMDTEDEISVTFQTRASFDTDDSRMAAVAPGNENYDLTIVDLEDDEISEKNARVLSISGDINSAEGDLSSTPQDKGSCRKTSRDSSNHRRQSRHRQQSAVDSQSGSRKRKQSRWSIRTLKKRFSDNGIDAIYQRYIRRIERILLQRLLTALLINTIIVQILFNAYGDDRGLDPVWCNLFISFWLLLSIGMSVLVFFQNVFDKSATVIGVVVWLGVNARQFVLRPFSHYLLSTPLTPSAHVPNILFIVLVTHTMLPLSRTTAVALAMTTSIVDLVISGIMTDVQGLALALQLVANFFIYVCGNLTGFYHKHLTDISHRHTFLDIRKFIELNLHSSWQKERQNAMKENLLLKIIPKHLLDAMKNILYQKLVEIDRGPEKVFHDMLVERHDGVSILYADIVNFTPLTSTLEPPQLVSTLNKLFGRFDELAKANNCLRIKMLGDCYCCVSGLPNSTPNHARNCVIMAMYIVKIIRKVRRETSVANLDMRIGIHTGYVLSGILGMKKWQYDIWSDDVTIANHVESGGLPGRVHISEALLNQLNGEFQVELGNGKLRDEFLRENDIETYFIADSELAKITIDGGIIGLRSHNADSVTLSSCSDDAHTFEGSVGLSCAKLIDENDVETPFRGLTDYNSELPVHEVDEVNKRLESAFELQHFTIGIRDQIRALFDPCSRRQYGGVMRHLKPISLRFRDPILEAKFLNRKDSTFKFYIACAFAIYLFIVVVQLTLLNGRMSLLISLLAGSILFFTQLVLVTGLKCGQRLARFPENSVRQKLIRISDTVTSRYWWKMAFTTVAVAFIFTASIVPVIMQSQVRCKQIFANKTWSTFSEQLTTMKPVAPIGPRGSTFDDSSQGCIFAPYCVYSCAATLMSCSVFIRVHNTTKTILKVICLIVFNVMYYTVFESVFRLFDEVVSYMFIPANIRATLNSLLFFVTFLLLDRQLEKNFRLDFMCKHRTRIEHDEVLRNDMVNEFLLVNILPRHVADHFMAPNRSQLELYHMICPQACIMFAAIPNFKAFFSTVDVSGIECLRLLNEIMISFDKVLIMSQFESLEKVKTIGSTYMAAAGLHPDPALQSEAEQLKNNVVSITKFAFAIQHQLSELSKDAFYEYKLRIGVSHGKVIAGVIGATMPQFDIWGDAVNVASRMESHGVIDRIQVDEATSRILSAADIECVSRGQLKIKGKGMMDVYLVSEKYSSSNDTCTSS